VKVTKRTKWEPAALMVLLLGLGLWIAFGPTGRPRFGTQPDASKLDVRIGTTRGVLEACTIDGAPAVRLWVAGGPPTPKTMTVSEAEEVLGAGLVRDLMASRGNAVFRWLNITSWASLAWVGIGLLGQLAFSGRMVLQWIVSEKHKRSVVTESFWWFSLLGGVTLFSYFIWRQDPVAILGQASGIVVYARNIRLLRKHARREARAKAMSVGMDPGPEPALET
jgi:lipid-A-disaccharide synthase-like uncharacterized protein